MSANTFSNTAFDVASVSLSAIRAFEASARHLSFTRAGLELSVTQGAISHQVKALEDRLGVALFRRTPRGLVLTDEGLALLIPVADTFERLSRALSQFEGGRLKEVLTVSAVGTFAVGWLMPLLPAFATANPNVDLRLLTNNNKVDIAGESLDYAIRFGDGAWHGVDSIEIMKAPLSVVCAPATANGLTNPGQLSEHQLLRSYRPQDWLAWFAKAGLRNMVAKGPLFDSSWIMVQAALQGDGVALVPAKMFEKDLTEGRLVKPFDLEVEAGSYWLTRLKSRELTAAMATFEAWIKVTA